MNDDPLTTMLDQLPGVMLREVVTLLWALLTSPAGIFLVALLITVRLHGFWRGFLRQIERVDRPFRGRRRW